MSRLFLAWGRTVSDFQDLRPPLSCLQFWLGDDLWTPLAGLCGFRWTGTLQASSRLGLVGILSREVPRTGRFLIEFSPVLLFAMKSLLVVAGGSQPDATCPGSPAEGMFGVSQLHRICSGSYGEHLWLRIFSPNLQVLI